MILLQQAFDIVMDASKIMASEKIPFNSAVGRILAEDVLSDMFMPPFDKSAMDGYACRMADISNPLTVIEVIPAGKTPEKTVGPNQCSKIMTGAPIPKGADCVLMVEKTKINEDGSISFLDEKTKPNICYLGEDVKQNDVVLKKGTLINPAHIAIMASVGCVNPLVYKKPRVAILSTGDEIIEPGFKPAISQIRNSNGHQLAAQVEQSGASANYLGIVEDNEDATFKAIKTATESNDVVLLTGGVSMGDFDFVPEILKKAGVNILFQKIAVQPGKPTTFGVHEKSLVFGLPGNPVSSFIQFELLVKPLLYKMMGHEFKPPCLLLPMDEDYTRKHADREAWFPIIITDQGTVKPVSYHGSAHINGLGPAHGIISIPIGVSSLKKGEKVNVRQI